MRYPKPILGDAPRDTLAAILCAASVRCRRRPPGAGAPAATPTLLLSARAAGVSFSRLLRLFSSLSTDLAPMLDLDLPLRQHEHHQLGAVSYTGSRDIHMIRAADEPGLKLRMRIASCSRSCTHHYRSVKLQRVPRHGCFRLLIPAERGSVKCGQRADLRSGSGVSPAMLPVDGLSVRRPLGVLMPESPASDSTVSQELLDIEQHLLLPAA